MHGDLSLFIAHFETVLGREDLQKAVSMESLIISKARTKRNFLELLEFYSPNCFSSLVIEQLNRVGRSNNRLGGIYI